MTSGSLELRLGEEAVVKGSGLDGSRVYDILNDLLDLYDSGNEPSNEQIKDWYEKSTEQITFFLFETKRQYRLGHLDHSVVVDINARKIFVERDNLPYFYDQVLSSDETAGKYQLKANRNLERNKFNIIFVDFSEPDELEAHGYTYPDNLESTEEE